MSEVGKFFTDNHAAVAYGQAERHFRAAQRDARLTLRWAVVSAALSGIGIAVGLIALLK